MTERNSPNSTPPAAVPRAAKGWLACAILFLTLTAETGAEGSRADPPARLNAAIDSTAVRLRWSPPDTAAGATEVLVLRRLNQPPAGPEDEQASIVYRGDANEATDEITGLLPGTRTGKREYFYTAFGCRPGGACGDPIATASLRPPLIDVLRGGGYVIHWRHTDAALCVDRLELGKAQETEVPDWWRSCDSDCQTATARQLSPKGVDDARALGALLRQQGVRFGRVIATEYCRTQMTAKLMDLGPPIEIASALTSSVYDETKRCQATFDLIHEIPAAGTNTAIVAHGLPRPCSYLVGPDQGEAVIFKPDGAGDAEFIAKVAVGDWSATPVVTMEAAVETTAVRLSWNPPAEVAGYTEVALLRQMDQPANTGQNHEPTLVYKGSDNQATDHLINLLPERKHTYTLYGCRQDGDCTDKLATASVEPTLIEALRGGGYVVYWRHATAKSLPDDRLDLGKADDTEVPEWWSKCEDEYARQLSDLGIAQATEIGKQLRRRRIPFGRVLSSEFCRSADTAKLMNLGPQVELSKKLTMFVYSDDARRCEDIYTMLGERPVPGTNTALVSHMLHPSCPIIHKPPEAGAVIFKPDGNGKAQFIRRVQAHDWARLEPLK